MPIVEKAILTYLRDTAFTTDFLTEVVKQANLFLKEEALRPKEDPKPLMRQLKSLKRERDRLAQAIASSQGKLDSLLKGLRKRERAIKTIRAELRKLKDVQMPVPEALDQAEVLSMLADLKSLLEENVAASAPVLRQVLGPIEIEPGSLEGTRRPVWLARFTVNLVPVLLHLSAKKQLPTTPGLEFLTRRRWKSSNTGSLIIREVPLYEQIKDEVAAFKAQGLSDEVIARNLNTTAYSSNPAPRSSTPLMTSWCTRRTSVERQTSNRAKQLTQR